MSSRFAVETGGMYQALSINVKNTAMEQAGRPYETEIVFS
jgi:hypothetical protein